MVEPKIKVKNQYTSSILKFKLNHKIQHNTAVAAFTQNKIPQLESLADDLRKTKSMISFDFENSVKPRMKPPQGGAASH
jgi:hypothetical protein